MLAYLPAIGEKLQHVVRGGSEVGADTLLAFYTYHTTVLPVLMICAMAYHFWRVRRAGGVVEPPAADDDAKTERVLFMPDLLVRETSQALVVVAVVVVLGALVGAATGDRAQPGMSPNPAKAPWYFMGFQELLIHLHPAVAVSIVPVALLIGIVTLPLIARDGETSGRWFLSDRGRRLALGAALSGAVLTLLAVLVDDRRLAAAGSANGWIERGVVPLLALVFAAVAGTLVVRRHVDGLSRNEMLQTLLVFLGASFATLTAVGVFLRGDSMALRLPWGG
jgi:quinol-cytochrome oxidoreductase complex cytochrome b subunit